MKFSKPRVWSRHEAQRLTALARQKICGGDIARELDRHVTSIRKKARELGLLLPKRPTSPNYVGSEIVQCGAWRPPPPATTSPLIAPSVRMPAHQNPTSANSWDTSAKGPEADSCTAALHGGDAEPRFYTAWVNFGSPHFNPLGSGLPLRTDISQPTAIPEK